eukprot:m.119859 g.119859  ORF g.119859 m.119859 type:complete len:68 (-) comp14336_c0_seq3:75-278(-)
MMPNVRILHHHYVIFDLRVLKIWKWFTIVKVPKKKRKIGFIMNHWNIVAIGYKKQEVNLAQLCNSVG